MATADVTIRGAGVFGLSVAWACVKRGAKVKVIDPNGVASGASGGIVGALAPHTPDNWYDKKEFQRDSLLMAEKYWARVATVSGHDPGYGRVGRLQPIIDERGLKLAHERVLGAKTHWLGQAEWQVVASADLGPWAPFSPMGLIARDTLSARLHPRRACLALAAAITACGGRIAVDGDTEGAEVWASGLAGLEQLGQELGQTVGVGSKGQAALLAYDAPTAPQIYANEVYIVPHNDGTVAVGSTTEKTYDAATTTDEKLDQLMARAFTVLPQLRHAPVLARWAGVRPRAIGRRPLLGAYPGRVNTFIANGGFKIGFGVAPKIGEVMADLILEGRNAIPEDFRIEAIL